MLAYSSSHDPQANCNRSAIEFSQDLIGELQKHLQDIVDLTHTHSKEGNHDASVNLQSSAIMTLLNLLELHRTLARSEVPPVPVRQHSRSRCGELLSDITLTAQKVVITHGEYLANFIVVCISSLLDNIASIRLAHAAVV